MALSSIISKYDLQPHPEGGFFKEMYRSESQVIHPFHGEARSVSTGILFLITPSNVSRLHRIASDEMWHFYCGSSMTVVEFIPGSGVMKRTVLGSNILGGEEVQYVVKAGHWFGSYGNSDSTSDAESAFSLVGCTVAPGFDFSDFDLASRASMLRDYALGAEAEREIIRLTEGLP